MGCFEIRSECDTVSVYVIENVMQQIDVVLESQSFVQDFVAKHRRFDRGRSAYYGW